ncbi:MAG: hypothetical protein V1801_02125 [Candidatus Falkowbacteria bacterium]
MKPIFYIRSWINVKFDKENNAILPWSLDKAGFRYYSNKIASGTDESLNDQQRAANYQGPIGWIRKHCNWQLCQILEPIGDPETKFLIGYYYPGFVKTPSNIYVPPECKIARTRRSVADGEFAMRVGVRECFYFVVGDKKILLKKHGYLGTKSKEATEGRHKDLKLH